MASHVLFLTGKLAEPALRRTLADLAPRAEFEYTVTVLPISVVALATVPWIARHVTIPEAINRVIVPGLCAGDLGPLQQKTGVKVERGPKDLRDLPEFFGAESGRSPDYGAYDIEILAEINHAPQLPLEAILTQARSYQAAGADVIDLGCDPGVTWPAVREAVRALRDAGLRVSIDSFNADEVDTAVAAGAELVLSVNQSNLAVARQVFERYGHCEFVAVPDVPANLDSLIPTVDALQNWGIPFRIDPVIEPIGFGFAASLGRYLEVRRRYPAAEIMMGVGNLTELTDVDSAGVNVMLLGFCQELGIRSVLTTEVINWCRSCVRELDLARRLVYYACKQHVLPKHIEDDLVLLRDPRLREHGDAILKEFAQRIKDRNFRVFAERGLLHVMNSRMFLQGADPFALFEEMVKQEPVDPAHAFYLGYEMAKAVTALTLGKNYVQDQALRWGILTAPETSHRGTLNEDQANASGETATDGS
jgi:dihydropteroate synthase-like protein